MKSFSTTDVHPRDRVSYWREVASRTFLELECVPEDYFRFEASLQTTSLADISLVTVVTDRCVVRRDARAISRSDADDLLLSIQLTGSTRLEQGSARALLRPGDCQLYDGSKPYVLEVLEHGSQLVAKIDRRHIESRIGCIERYAASMPGQKGIALDIASHFWRLLPTRADAMHERLAGAMATQALDLLSTAMHEQAINARTSTAAICALVRLKNIIEGRLTDPSLSCEDVAAIAGISRRYASKLFRGEGLSMQSYITDRRLDRCRDALAARNGFARSAGEIAYAWGFKDLAHFSRSFKKRFGRTPREFKAETRSGAQETGIKRGAGLLAV